MVRPGSLDNSDRILTCPHIASQWVWAIVVGCEREFTPAVHLAEPALDLAECNVEDRVGNLKIDSAGAVYALMDLRDGK